ncbi:Hpt domain-containing protein [Roseobacter sp. HKCCA0434]|uniref:Hpt domain-containing protein n=1 Tax=Roseobacter sp. HKCCA0434 TaxID=3079297 RepID=UPI0029058D87|nr:Hpt domain-containing protein [Roseobacter sp. HKCCA0434]
MSSPVLDPEVWGALQAAMGPDMVPRLVAQLRDDLDASAERLQAAAGRGDLDAVRAEAHAMAGMAGSVGAAELSLAVERLRSAAVAGDRDTLQLQVSAVCQAIKRLLSTLNSV